MSAHTPGPWTDGREGSGDFISPAVIVLGDTGACGSCGGGPGEIFIKAADKRLIKAAPEMADALRAMLKQFGPSEVWDDDDKRLACENASAALRKAGRLL